MDDSNHANDDKFISLLTLAIRFLPGAVLLPPLELFPLPILELSFFLCCDIYSAFKLLTNLFYPA